MLHWHHSSCTPEQSCGRLRRQVKTFRQVRIFAKIPKEAGLLVECDWALCSGRGIGSCGTPAQGNTSTAASATACARGSESHSVSVSASVSYTVTPPPPLSLCWALAHSQAQVPLPCLARVVYCTPLHTVMCVLWSRSQTPPTTYAE